MAGEVIQNPYHWFENLMIDNWGDTKALYMQQTPEVQAQVDTVFGASEQVFVRRNNFVFWINARLDKPEELEEAKRQLSQIMGLPA